MDSHLLHCGYATLLLDPFEVLKSAVDGNSRRCVEHAALADMGAVVEHRRNSAAHLAQQVFLHNHEGDTCHREVLLGTTVDQAILAHVDGTAEDIRAHVGNHRNGAVVILQNLCTIDGVVRGDVEVISIRRNRELLGNVGEVLVLAGCNFDNLAKELSLFLCFCGPNTSIQVGSFLLQKVEGDHAELQAGATAKEDDTVAFGDVKELLEESNCLIHNGLEVLGTMAHFHEREAAALKVEARSSCGLHHFAGKFAGAGIEIVLLHMVHNLSVTRKYGAKLRLF